MVAVTDAVLAVPHMLLNAISKSTTVITNAVQAEVAFVRQNGVLDAIVKLYNLIFGPFGGMAGDSDFERIMDQRVSTFYAGLDDYDDANVPTFLIASMIASLFGSIHCIGWTFPFPSHTEQFLWHLSSFAITFIPLLPLLVYYISFWRSLEGLLSYWSYRVLEWLWIFIGVIYFLCSFLYVLGRVTLLVLVLASLRCLPAEAYRTVNWTTFIPHV